MEKKCKIGETNFIDPPRPCAPNLWKEGAEKYKEFMKKMEEKKKKWQMDKKKYSYPTFWGEY